MVHAALLLLMLGAVHTDLVSPSAWSAAPKSSAIHKLPADYPIFGSLATEPRRVITDQCPLYPIATIQRMSSFARNVPIPTVCSFEHVIG